MTIERTGPLRAPFVRLFIALAFVVPVLVAHVAIWQLAEVLGSLASAVFSAAVACLGGWAAYEAKKTNPLAYNNVKAMPSAQSNVASMPTDVTAINTATQR